MTEWLFKKKFTFLSIKKVFFSKREESFWTIEREKRNFFDDWDIKTKVNPRQLFDWSNLFSKWLERSKNPFQTFPSCLNLKPLEKPKEKTINWMKDEKDSTVQIKKIPTTISQLLATEVYSLFYERKNNFYTHHRERRERRISTT